MRKERIQISVIGICCFLLIFTTTCQLMVETNKVEACNNHRPVGSAHIGHFTDPERLQIVYGAAGTLFCEDMLSGEVIWQFNYGKSLEYFDKLGSYDPYWFWHPIKTAADSPLLDLLVWNTTSQPEYQWEIYDGRTLEKVDTLSQSHDYLSHDYLAYAWVKDIDADGVEEVILGDAFTRDILKIYDLNRVPQTIIRDYAYIVSVMEEASFSDSLTDFEGDGQYEYIVYAKNETHYRIGLFDWQNNWTVLQQFTFPYDGSSWWYLGNYTGASVLDRVYYNYGRDDQPTFLEFYNQTDLVWNFTLCSRGFLNRQLSHDIDGDGILELIFYWREYSEESFKGPPQLTLVSPKERRVWWNISFQFQHWRHHAHGNYPPNYFDRCFADFTEDGIEDLVFPGKESLCVIDGITGNMIREYNYSNDFKLKNLNWNLYRDGSHIEVLLPHRVGIISHIEVYDIDQDQVPEIILTDYVSNPSGTVVRGRGITEYAFYFINGSTQEIKTIFPYVSPSSETPSLEDQFIGFVLIYLFGSLGGLAILIIVIMKFRER